MENDQSKIIITFLLIFFDGGFGPFFYWLASSSFCSLEGASGWKNSLWRPASELSDWLETAGSVFFFFFKFKCEFFFADQTKHNSITKPKHTQHLRRRRALGHWKFRDDVANIESAFLGVLVFLVVYLLRKRIGLLGLRLQLLLHRSMDVWPRRAPGLPTAPRCGCRDTANRQIFLRVSGSEIEIERLRDWDWEIERETLLIKKNKKLKQDTASEKTGNANATKEQAFFGHARRDRPAAARAHRAAGAGGTALPHGVAPFGAAPEPLLALRRQRRLGHAAQRPRVVGDNVPPRVRQRHVARRRVQAVDSGDEMWIQGPLG
jgi:hypothetical protein